jgi:hypothetical protein
VNLLELDGCKQFRKRHLIYWNKKVDRLLPNKEALAENLHYNFVRISDYDADMTVQQTKKTARLTEAVDR